MMKACHFFATLVLVVHVLQAQYTHHAEFTGSLSKYFSTPGLPSLLVTGDFTIEAWVKFDSLPTTPPQIVFKGAERLR